MMQVLQGATFIRFGLKAFLSLSFIIYTKLVILSLLYSDEWRKQKDSSALATPCMLVHVLLVFGRDSNSRERGKSQHDFQTRTPRTTKNNQKNKCESLRLPPLFFVCVFLCCWGAKSYDTAAIDLQMCVNYVYPSGMHTVLFISSSWQKKGSPSSLIKERERSLFPRDFVFYDWTTPVEKKGNIIQRSHCRANISWIKRPTKNELKGCHSI